MLLLRTRTSVLRVLVAALAFVSVFFAPPWVPLIFSGVLALRFFAWEAVAVGFLIDMLYAPGGAYLGMPMPATLAMLFVVVLLHPWRKQLAL